MAWFSCLYSTAAILFPTTNKLFPEMATQSSSEPHVTGARLRKDRNDFQVHPEPDKSMSNNRFFDTLLGERPLSDELAPLAKFFQRESSARERFGWVLRDSLDELLDGQRTGRWCYQHLSKTERTYLGTAVEINLAKEFEILDGRDLDWRVGGIDLDCKFSKDFGGWEIPVEMYRCADHGEQTGSADRPALLVWMDDDNKHWAAGLIKITDDVLAFKQDGSGKRAYNRDFKRKLSKEGLHHVHWMWGGLQSDLPENLLLHLAPEVRDRIFQQKSGQARLNTLFRETAGHLVTRSTVLTVAQQDDSLKRARDSRLKKHLGKEGFIILGHQEADPTIASVLDLPVPVKGEFVACKVKPVQPSHRGPKVYLLGKWWAKADPSEQVPSPAPERKRFKKADPESIATGTSDISD